MTSQAIVKTLLEDDYDAHVKAHQKVQTWDKAHASAKKLLGLKLQSVDKFRELGRALGYERALAHVGLTRDDVEHQIYGAQIGSTHNYKKTHPVRKCSSTWCNDRRNQPETQDVCPTCGEQLFTKQVPYSFTELHDKMARYMLGVETKDGRRVWFIDPLPPTFEPETEPKAPEKYSPEKTERSKKLGKWW